MHELARYLYLGGGIPLFLLGVAHVRETPLSPTDRKGLSPRDPDLPAQMARSTVRLTRETDVWRAWVGFNLSHSLGAIALPVLVWATGYSSAIFSQNAAVCVPLAALFAALYVLLAVRYWFRIPLLGCLLTCASFLASWALVVVA